MNSSLTNRCRWHNVQKPESQVATEKAMPPILPRIGQSGSALTRRQSQD